MRVPKATGQCVTFAIVHNSTVLLVLGPHSVRPFVAGCPSIQATHSTRPFGAWARTYTRLGTEVLETNAFGRDFVQVPGALQDQAPPCQHTVIAWWRRVARAATQYATYCAHADWYATFCGAAKGIVTFCAHCFAFYDDLRTTFWSAVHVPTTRLLCKVLLC